MMLLKDKSGAARLIESLTRAARDFSLLYAFTDDESARVHLAGYVERIRPGIVEAVGSDNAATALDAFVAAVIGEKHRIENVGASRA
ncbi:hypothetical protein CK489_29095 [Bradyrhizobium sp. UFLA03-84]|uniref:hypothetical protein n=1 Tax=Bradyrhizobium sp. UFLA03-84 TaxID=418599 RepID=UPI000BAE4500|nr:hypothetical protein [Bradyrhizobium sp. UFLA03-84]PAY05442.1 hypothetical protein CK489_29095 [Bradyrhizobium sp. UFLA03-84]